MPLPIFFSFFFKQYFCFSITWVFPIICFCIIGFGWPIILFKKHKSAAPVHPIPIPTIQLNEIENDTDNHIEARIKLGSSIKEKQRNDCKYNQNLVTTAGLVALTLILILFVLPVFLTRHYELIRPDIVRLYLFVLECCVPVA